MTKHEELERMLDRADAYIIVKEYLEVLPWTTPEFRHEMTKMMWYLVKRAESLLKEIKREQR